jgi:hypothetical protein
LACDVFQQFFSLARPQNLKRAADKMHPKWLLSSDKLNFYLKFSLDFWAMAGWLRVRTLEKNVFHTRALVEVRINYFGSDVD